MACETCDHTMQGVGMSIPPVAWWCERCGTIKEAGASHPPKLVERCRAFEKRYEGQWVPQKWDFVADGISESINIPENRT